MIFNFFRKPSSLSNIIKSASSVHEIASKIIAGVILVESSGNPKVSRYEDGFYQRYIAKADRQTLKGYIPNSISLDTEKRLRAFSWGAMQIMGQVARERGYKKEFLYDLLDPDVNIHLGTQILAGYFKATGHWNAALLRYNGGGDAEYPNRVFKKITSGAVNSIL